jgi:beta-alanine--pyruvate transaminase
VIVEPVAGSTGVLVPPEGYLQRLRAICDKHDILLIFDEVITGFGRVGAAFAAERFGVIPDMICMAKGLTNAAVPAGAVAASEGVYQAMMDGADAPIELFHGYTYSAHPLACAAGLAALEVYQEEGLFARALEMEPYWRAAVHSLKRRPPRDRHPRLRPDRRDRAGAEAGRADRPGDGRLRDRLRPGPADPRDRRHHRVVAAADHREGQVDQVVETIRAVLSGVE